MVALKCWYGLVLWGTRKSTPCFFTPDGLAPSDLSERFTVQLSLMSFLPLSSSPSPASALSFSLSACLSVSVYLCLCPPPPSLLSASLSTPLSRALSRIFPLSPILLETNQSEQDWNDCESGRIQEWTRYEAENGKRRIETPGNFLPHTKFKPTIHNTRQDTIYFGTRAC